MPSIWTITESVDWIKLVPFKELMFFNQKTIIITMMMMMMMMIIIIIIIIIMMMMKNIGRRWDKMLIPNSRDPNNDQKKNGAS